MRGGGSVVALVARALGWRLDRSRLAFDATLACEHWLEAERELAVERERSSALMAEVAELESTLEVERRHLAACQGRDR